MLSSSNGSEADLAAKLGAWLYLEELNHRTLNNYTAMLAIVRQAARSAPDEISGRALDQVGSRLQAAAMSFLALRPPADCSLRDLGGELSTLCTSLSENSLSHRRITLTLDCDPITMNAHRCWQLSLIVSELITNASRHAFRLREEGRIKVSATVSDGKIELAVSDDGICSTDVTAGRGTAIIDALINDLGGTVSRQHSVTGSSIAFSIPVADATFVPAFRHLAQPLAHSQSIPPLLEESER